MIKFCDVLRGVSAFYGMPVEAIINDKRRNKRILATQTLSYVAYRLLPGRSINWIAIRIKKDRSTVSYHIEQTAKKLAQSQKFAAVIEQLIDDIRNGRPITHTIPPCHPTELGLSFMRAIVMHGSVFTSTRVPYKQRQEPGRQWCRRHDCVSRKGHRWSLTEVGRRLYEIHVGEYPLKAIPRPELKQMKRSQLELAA